MAPMLASPITRLTLCGHCSRTVAPSVLCGGRVHLNLDPQNEHRAWPTEQALSKCSGNGGINRMSVTVRHLKIYLDLKLLCEMRWNEMRWACFIIPIFSLGIWGLDRLSDLFKAPWQSRGTKCLWVCLTPQDFGGSDPIFLLRGDADGFRKKCFH